jgi:hypothetical protein
MMKTFYIKKEKWFRSNYSIYSESKLIGQFIPEKWKSVNWVIINDENYMIKPKSFWKDEKLIYLDNNLIGTIQNKPFKSFFIISIIGKSDYIVKMNFWGTKCSIMKEDLFVGEYIINWRGSVLNTETPVDNSVIAATLVQVNSIKRRSHNAAV